MKIIVITGVSSGIGFATATLLSESHKVYGLSRTRPESEFPFNWLQADVTDKSSISRVIQTVLEEHDCIDVLINNAGISELASVEHSNLDLARQIMETNFFGSLTCIQQVIPAMKKRGEGLIINISSIGGRVGLPFQGLYCASKFALEGLTESLRMEVAQYGINAILLEPGDCKTSISFKRTLLEKDLSSGYTSPIQRTESKVKSDEQNGFLPEDIAVKILRLIEKNPKRMRYTVGPLLQRLVPSIKNLLPERWFEKLLIYYYQLQ